jgi:NADH:ubiquinone reductase (H+-translocating)
MNKENKEKPRVLILGAGFGGLTAAIALAKTAKVTLVDRHNFQTFLPLLYQVSTAGLAADHVAYPIRGALRGLPIEFRMGSPISINHREKSVKLDSSEEIYFDHLIIAEHALGMKTIHEALTIRAEVMRRFEDLCRFNDDTKLGIVVVGGGPTGVEMAGALAELIRGPLKGDHAEAAANINISLIEAGDRLLPALHPSLSDRTFRDLEKMGVHVLTNTAVAEVAPRIIKFKDGTQIGAEITIWAAGVRGVPILEELNIPLNRGRIDSEQTLQVKNYPYIWAIGDNSGSVDENGKHYPMIAPVALQQARFVAQQISQLVQGKDLKKFKYRDKGAMATIGRHKAVVEVKGLRISGFVAWGIWLFLHLFYLLGGRNKIGTIADWSWNYLTFDRGNRHIMDAL